MKSFWHSPVGWLALLASDEVLKGIKFLETKPDYYPQETNTIIQQTETELSEYFSGERKTFSIPLGPEGTDFQQTVWKELCHIPYGQTINYGQLAQKLGDIKKVRAVGRANGQNPIPIIIPCHRVIGSDNNLVGYAGGISRKQFLLKHEGALLL
ncbi:methylated-DNA--[protein]-cysteine S-methyltransferase [Fodinibius salsisoli]|uniref:Methylated-DNA--protein-cysteine methyltransferase n=1 Tax=Fodinibius salsisoli TaxID=2820877 RepID=A0ABT3PLA1_9BACT|nr:methylated-DNA--[protein]-cysteine S-methyltransferase [Fodinibius salsisoli]MCW9706711.1 methylated-DNA--[protein]-cysteine S-methyltransferase [Fodinibius salsisoli]